MPNELRVETSLSSMGSSTPVMDFIYAAMAYKHGISMTEQKYACGGPTNGPLSLVPADCLQRLRLR